MGQPTKGGQTYIYIYIYILMRNMLQFENKDRLVYPSYRYCTDDVTVSKSVQSENDE